MIEYAVRRQLLDNAAVAALVSDRIYPLMIPQGEPLPAITYSVVATDEDNQEGDADTLARARVQLDCWATTYKQANDLARAVRLALPTTTGAIGSGANRVEGVSIIPIETGRQFYEPDTRYYRVMLEFYVWFPTTVNP